ncbi:MYXO-CTERM sorting domain-containing protein [Sorangium sp. So ce861]|uniref:MYXO-CTERM sorting domain-containing protein n=1 Tax=Sorangium sp. So ce861 TaxID=3133323 RepID=UPI003F62A79E
MQRRRRRWPATPGGGCRMTPRDQSAPPWLLLLGGLAAVRLRRRSRVGQPNEPSNTHTR